MIIHYYTKEVYGHTLMYLASLHDATNWYRISGKKTIDQRSMDALKELTGVSFERVFEAEL